VTRRLLAIQQSDIEICNIKGANSILSRYSSQLGVAEARDLARPGTIRVHAIHLKIDNSVCKDLKNLGKLQDTDTRLKGLKDRITESINTPPERNLSRKKTCYSVGGTLWTRGSCCRLV
jgi:hypothetical protein